MSDSTNNAGAKLDAAIKKRRESVTFLSIFSIIFTVTYRFIRQLLRLETIRKVGNMGTEQLTEKEHIPMEHARPYDK